MHSNYPVVSSTHVASDLFPCLMLYFLPSPLPISLLHYSFQAFTRSFRSWLGPSVLLGAVGCRQGVPAACGDCSTLPRPGYPAVVMGGLCVTACLPGYRKVVHKSSSLILYSTATMAQGLLLQSRSASEPGTRTACIQGALNRNRPNSSKLSGPNV